MGRQRLAIPGAEEPCLGGVFRPLGAPRRGVSRTSGFGVPRCLDKDSDFTAPLATASIRLIVCCCCCCRRCCCCCCCCCCRRHRCCCCCCCCCCCRCRCCCCCRCCRCCCC